MSAEAPKFLRKALIAAVAVGAGTALAAEIDFNTSTGPQRQAIIDSSYATGSDASRIIRETGLEGQHKIDVLVFVAGASLLYTAGMILYGTGDQKRFSIR